VTAMASRVFKGCSGFGGPILTIDNNGRVYEGTPVFPLNGTPIMKISGDHIYKGSISWGGLEVAKQHFPGHDAVCLAR